MLSSEVQVGTTITDGEKAVRVTRQFGRDGWVGIYISFRSGKLTGMECLVPIEELACWQPVPWEWTPLESAGIEHRYVWSADCRALEHEIRTAERV
jgi:hypothetical protein